MAEIQAILQEARHLLMRGTRPATPTSPGTGCGRGSPRAVAALDPPPPTPLMVVDLDAFDANAADLARRAGGKPIRVASKSLRVPALIERALAHPGFHGVLAYTLREALWLEQQGITDDIVIAYPTVDRAALAELVASPVGRARAITLMVDDVAQLDVVDSVRVLARGAGCGSRSTSTPGCGWAASTSAPSAPRCTTPTTSCALARHVTERGRVRAGRGDDLRGPGRRRARRRAVASAPSRSSYAGSRPRRWPSSPSAGA